MEELENEEQNRELCALAVDEMFELWSPEIQEQVLAEWNDWKEAEKSGCVCDHCGKEFTRSDNLRRHIKRVHTGEKLFACETCDKSFATADVLKRHKKIHQRKPSSVINATRNLIARYVYTL
jgi:uncharacterized Zn-finger protein